VSLIDLALGSAVKARARELGFDRVAIGPAEPPEHGDALEAWLDAGYAGTMSYLDRGRADRLDPARLLPGCRSVVAVAMSYNPGASSAGDGAQHERATMTLDDWRPVSRYARGRDYHDVIRPRLVELGEFIHTASGAASRVAVDSSAVLERDLAARAGLGWVGKNTNLLTPSLGSYFFIGIVLTTAKLPFDQREPDRCGTCTACLDACPTRAFVAPYVLDARRCISYLTIEHRGDIAGELAEQIGEWVFGCDVCQEVCPWNRKAEPAREPALGPSGPFGALETLLELDSEAFRARFRGSALTRAKRAGLLRNAAIVLANRGERRATGALNRALGDEDAVVRHAAAWALEKLGAGPETAKAHKLITGR
jgi:epoxyqueuosine reductase